MARLIFSIIFLVALAILIVMNAGSATSVNVFGWKVESLSVTVVAIVSFVAGVIYSFVFYLIAYLERGRKERLAKKKRKLKDQEAELKNRTQEADDLAEESRRRIETAERQAGPVPLQARGGPLAALFGRGRSANPETPAEEPARDDKPKRSRKN